MGRKGPRAGTFGHRLQKAIAQSGKTNEEVAADLREDPKLRTAAPRISEWIHNEDQIPEGRVLLRLPGILGVDGHWLLTGEKRRPSHEVRAYQVIARVVGSVERGGDPIATALDALEVLRLAEDAEEDEA